MGSPAKEDLGPLYMYKRWLAINVENSKFRGDDLYITQCLCCLLTLTANATRKMMTYWCAKHTTAICQLAHFKILFFLLLLLQVLPLLTLNCATHVTCSRNAYSIVRWWHSENSKNAYSIYLYENKFSIRSMGITLRKIFRD